MSRRGLAIGAGIFSTAYLLRLAYLHQIARSPFFDFLHLDPLYYHDWAVSLTRGDWIGREVFEQSPLYPYLLALHLIVFGHDLWALRLIQIGVGSLTCVITYALGCRLFDRRAGVIAGLGCALYGPLLFYEGQVMKEFLTPPLGAGALLLLVAARGRLEAARSSHALLAAAGGLIGAAALVRDNFLLLVPLLAASLWAPRPRRPLRPLTFVAGALAVLAPVALRNYAVSGDLVLTTSGGGEVFYIGNGPYANGAYVPPPWVRSNPRFEHEDFRARARALSGRGLTRAGASRFWWREGLAWMAANPGRSVLLWLRKAALFWNDYELADNYSFYSFRRFSWLLSGLLTFGPVAALAAAGAVVSWPERERLLPLYLAGAGYVISVLLFFNFARFRLPIVPLLLVLAGRGVTGVWEAARAGSRAPAPSRRRALAALAAAAAALPLLYVDWSSAAEEPFQDRLHLAAAFRQAGRLDEAEAPLRLTIEEAEAIVRRHGGDPGRPESVPGGVTFRLALAAAHRDLAGILAERGDPASAAAEYGRAAALSPDDADLQLRLASALRAADDLEGAARACRRALQIDPTRFAARFDLANVLYAMGRDADALAELERARDMAPSLGDLNLADWHYGMGMVLQGMPGRDGEAAAHFTDALRLNPGAPLADRARAFLSSRATAPPAQAAPIRGPP